MELKMTVEIKDDRFQFATNIGKSSHNGSMPVDTEGLLLFTELLGHLNKNTMRVDGQRHKAWEAYVFCQAHPELMKEVEKDMKKGLK